MKVIQRKGPKEEKQGLPAWVVSFTDMITLLLSFFIMLQALAEEQSNELFYVGQGSFKRAITGFGLPSWLVGEHETPLEGHKPYRYPAEEDKQEPSDERLIDPEDQEIRKLFEDLRRLMKETETSRYKGRPADVHMTPITFDAGEVDLDEKAKAYLKTFASGLLERERARVVVIGLAPDETSPRLQYILSARRARATRTCLADALETIGSPDVELAGWGAGRSTRWAGQETAGGGKAYVVLAVMDATEQE